MVGFASPLTDSGTFIANGVLVSSYSNINPTYHELANAAMWPLK